MKRLALALAILLVSMPAEGGMNELLQVIAESEFEFQKTDSDLPYPPFVWIRAARYRNTLFSSGPTDLQDIRFDQTVFSHVLFSPVYASERDIIMAGYYYGLSTFDFSGAAFDQGDVHLIGAGAAWLRQVKTNWLTGLFAAPLMHSNIRGGTPWETEWYMGTMAQYYYAPHLQLFLGGVYIHSFGQNVVYPYLGAIWLAQPSLSVAATLPWPSVSYAINTKTILRVGASPSGAQWRAQNDEQIYHDFGGWDLGFTLERETIKRLWLSASVGWSGLRAFSINEAGSIDYRTELDGSPYWGLRLAFRP